MLHHDHLPLLYNGAAPFPDHADRGAPRPPRMAVDEWRFASQLRESHKFMTVPHSEPGQYSIRINEKYRICFHWENGYADDVGITDYY